MTLRARAILAYEAKREAERVEAELSAQRAKEAHKTHLRTLCTQVFDLDSTRIDVQWIGFDPVLEIDGLLFTCYEGMIEDSPRLMTETGCFRVTSLTHLGEILLAGHKLAILRDGNITYQECEYE